MDQYLDVYENYLQHYGILGMKWGVRRFQNKDGTFTKAGEDRYRSRKQLSLKNRADKAYKLGDKERAKELEKKLKRQETIDKYAEEEYWNTRKDLKEFYGYGRLRSNLLPSTSKSYLTDYAKTKYESGGRVSAYDKNRLLAKHFRALNFVRRLGQIASTLAITSGVAYYVDNSQQVNTFISGTARTTINSIKGVLNL